MYTLLLQKLANELANKAIDVISQFNQESASLRLKIYYTQWWNYELQ